MIGNFILFKDAILLGLVGVLGIVDSRLLGRSNFEQPLIMATISGLVLGDVTTGLMMGVALQLVFMGFVNIGAAAPPDIVYGSIIATAFVILSGATQETALTVALPVAILGQLIGTVLRMIISSFTYLSKQAIERGHFRQARNFHIVWGTLSYCLLYFIPIFFSIWLGVDLVKNIVDKIPLWLTDGLSLASKILPAFGFALLMRTMLSKKTVAFLLLGFFLTVYGNISVIGVAIFAILLALIINEILPKLNDQTIGQQNKSATVDQGDLEEL